MNLTEARERMNGMLSKRSHAAERVKEERKALTVAEDRLANLLEAQTILQKIAQTVQQQAHDRIAAVVSRCLSAVFAEEAYEFRIAFERKRGRTEARLVFVRDGHELSPRSSSGGGVIDVAAFALRLACLMLSRPSLRRLIVLDEPFRFVSSEYRPQLKAMLETLAKEMDVQFVLVTHIEDLEIGKVVEIE